MSASTEFVTSLPFLGYKQRNAVLDSFFYDTASLTVEEKTKLSPLVDREGSIIVVPPSNSDRQIRHYKRALRFMNKEGPTIRAIAVAGVGSSVLGTAALARNIADALDTPVYAGPAKEIGWHSVSLTGDATSVPAFEGFPDMLVPFHWHGDTFDIPPGCVRLAGSEACPNQAFSFDARVFALQFHLEATAPGIDALIQKCAHELVAGDYIQSAIEMRAQYTRIAAANSLMHRLLEQIVS